MNSAYYNFVFLLIHIQNHSVMNNKILRICFFTGITFFTFFSCNNSRSQSVKLNYPIERTDTCIANSHHTYQLYIPTSFSKNITQSFVLLLDSHGDGKFAMNNFKEAADKYGVGLIASNRIKNNDPTFLKEIDELVQEVKDKYAKDAKIYLAGFSGGARMALVYVVNKPVDGVIACGALAGPDQLHAISCPVIGVVGMDDFNFMEAAQYLLYPDKKPGNTRLVFTNDSHAWPGKEIVTSILGQMILPNNKGNESQLNMFLTNQKKHIQFMAKNENVINAACQAQNMSTVPAFEKDGYFGIMYQNIVTSKEYKDAMKELTSGIDLEIHTRKSLLPALLQKDSVWWKNEIVTLQDKAKNGETSMEEMTYKRILGFIGIACYSMSRQFLNKKDESGLSHILMVYRLVEPENEDMKHFTAELEKMRE